MPTPEIQTPKKVWGGAQIGAGRPKGRLNEKTLAVQTFARSFVEDPDYRLALRARLLLGEANAVEAMLWHYAYGKPKETVELQGGVDIVTEVRNIIVDVKKEGGDAQ